MLWFEQGWKGGDGWILSGDVVGHARILGVDPPGQHEPPRVRYGMACLLIRYVVGCVLCSVEWGWLPSL
jgi:hypothetical protein